MDTRWGILGTGGIAATFVTDLARAEGAVLAAVGSRAAETAEKFATTHGAARAHGSWAGLAADPDVDVIYVATPHAAHFDATMECLAAGKPVLCEKPMTLDAPSATLMVQEARARHVFLMEAMWMRCNPVIRRMAEMVRDGAVGTVLNVHADFGLSGPWPAEHRLRNPELGGGALLDLGVYPVNFAHLILGPPSEARAWASLTPEGVDQNTGLLLGYASGALATLTCGLNGATRNSASITGTTGRIDLPEPFFAPQSFTLLRDDAEAEVVRMPFEGRGYQFEALEVQRCLAEGLLESPLVPQSTTLEIMALMDMLREEVGVHYPNSGLTTR